MASGDTLFVGIPESNEPPSSGYQTIKVLNGHLFLNATDGNTDAAIFKYVMPLNYAAGGVTAYVEWAAVSDTNTSHTIGWDITFERDNAAVDLTSDHWATAQTITAAVIPAAAGTSKITNVAITAGATGTASIAAGDPFRVRVRRLSSDTATGGAYFCSLMIKET